MTDLERLLREHGSAPDHGPGFEDRLWASIAADGDGAAAAAAGGSAAEAGVVMAAPARRRSHRRARFLALVAAAAVAAAIVLAVAVSRNTIQELRHPAPASAAEKVAAHVRLALSDLRTLRVDETESFKVVKGPPESQWKPGWTTADWWARARIYGDKDLKALQAQGYENSALSFPTEHVIVTADGRWRKIAPENGADNPPVIVDQYTGDNRAGVMKFYSPSDPTLLHVTTDTSLGSPDDDLGDNGVALQVDFIRPATLSALAHGTVRDTTVDGRPCLTVSCAVAPQPIAGLNMDAHAFDTVAYTVDRDTWLIVRSTLLLRGQVVFQDRLTNIRVNEPVGPAEFEPATPRDTFPRETSLHFRRVSFEEAADKFSTTPLEPRVLPSGFKRFAAAVAPTAKLLYWSETGEHGYWPPSSDVTQLGYRAGLLKCLVTTRAQPSGGDLPTDLLRADPFVHEGSADVERTSPVESVELTAGAWRGVTAYLTSPLLEAPHLWVWNDGVLVTIGGDLTREQLLEMADSLEPMK